MSVRIIFSGSQQVIQEFCEHCNEFVRELHISDIATIKENDPRTVRIRDKDNNLKTLRKRQDKVKEVSESFKRKGLLDDTEAQEAFTKKEFKYGARPEAMCSESIDITANVTQSFCYRVAANPADVRFQKVVGGQSLSASFANAEKTDTTGSRSGVDRKGKVIKLNKYNRINMDTGVKETTEKYPEFSPYQTAWFRGLRDRRDEQYLIEGAQSIQAFVERHGSRAKDMTVVGLFRDRAEFVAAVNRDVDVSRGERSLR